MPDCGCDVAALTALGYFVLDLNSGQMFCHLALASALTAGGIPDWVGVWNPLGGFTQTEARAVAVDRGGWIWDGGVFRWARRV